MKVYVVYVDTVEDYRTSSLRSAEHVASEYRALLPGALVEVATLERFTV